MLKRSLLFFGLFLAHLALWVRADYTIDDSNYSALKFSENPAGPVWGPFGSDTGEVLQIRLPNGTMQTVDATQCYNGTYTYAACSTSNNCAVQFSFTGSGITIYVLQAGPQGMSASLSIDSGTATTATLGAPSAPQYYIPHVVLFNVQNVVSGTHNAVMTVLDWNGGFSGMMLDYIDVSSQPVVSGSTTSSTTSSTPSSASTPPISSPLSSPSSLLTVGTQTTTQNLTASQTASGSTATTPLSSETSSGVTAPPSTSTSFGTTTSRLNKNNVVAIAGGTAGGVGLLAAFSLSAFFCYRRRHRRRRVQNMGRVGSTPYDATNMNLTGSFAELPASRPSGILQLLRQSSSAEASDSTANLAVRNQSSSSPLTRSPSSASVVASASTTSQDLEAPAELGIDLREKSRTVLDSMLMVPHNSSAGREALGVRPSAVLTNEQADFVNNLFNRKIPAPVVARVIERMVSPQGANNVDADDPEVRAYDSDLVRLFPLSHTHSLVVRGVSRLPAISDFGDGETTTGTAPPSYDDVGQGQGQGM